MPPAAPRPLSLVPYDSPGLRQVVPVTPTPVTAEVGRDLADLLTTLLGHPNALGLAANQVGLAHRAFAWTHPEHGGVVLNPTFTDVATQAVVQGEEGCLSLPGTRVRVIRHPEIWASWTTLVGEPRTVTLTGLWAVCFQHETAHLNGQLIIDGLPPAEQATILAAHAKKARKAANRQPYAHQA